MSFKTLDTVSDTVITDFQLHTPFLYCFETMKPLKVVITTLTAKVPKTTVAKQLASLPGLPLVFAVCKNGARNIYS